MKLLDFSINQYLYDGNWQEVKKDGQIKDLPILTKKPGKPIGFYILDHYVEWWLTKDSKGNFLFPSESIGELRTMELRQCIID